MSSVFKPIEARNPFWLGVVATVTLVALVLVTLGFGALGLGQSRYAAEFAQSGDVRAGDSVRVAGMDVGQVTDTRLEYDHVLVSFRVDRRVRLGADTVAAIKLATLLGSRYLELHPAGTRQLPGGRIVLAHTSVPYDLQQVLQTGTPLLEDLDPTSCGPRCARYQTTCAATGRRSARLSTDYPGCPPWWSPAATRSHT